ncbi:MAG: hypothetical protein ACE5KV_06400, partial [Thermoplasmata archaeon]
LDYQRRMRVRRKGRTSKRCATRERGVDSHGFREHLTTLISKRAYFVGLRTSVSAWFNPK